jgi:Zn-dependent alcohol dehydrogenase
MKAVILREINKPLEICDVGLTSLQFGQVKVKNILSGLCGAQLQEISGVKGNAKFVPHLMGHEGCGIVEEIGLGVTKVKPGDKVVMHWRVGSGIESPFPSYILDGKTISSGKITTLSEYSIVSENRITPVEKNTSPELCALLGCGMTTALGTINNEAKVKFGESIAIIGCGGVGLNLIQGASMANAFPVYAIDINNNKEQLSKSLGADYFININSDLSFKVDIVIDTTGNSDAIEKTIPLLNNSGRYILVSQLNNQNSINIKNINAFFGGSGKQLFATQGGKTNPDEDIKRYVNLYNGGKLNISKVITHRFKIDKINDAIETLRSGNAGRIIIDIG